MRGRFIGWFVAAGVTAGLLLLGMSSSEAAHTKGAPKKHKIVYQLDDVDKTKFVLGNIQNHINGVGGWDHIEALELVVFGPALKSFVTKSMDPEVKQLLERLRAEGVVLGACGNTMKGLNITLDQLPEGASPLPQGGVVRIMELQEQGYAYIRP